MALLSLVVENCRIGTATGRFLRTESPRARAVGLMIILKICGWIEMKSSEMFLYSSCKRASHG